MALELYRQAADAYMKVMNFLEPIAGDRKVLFIEPGSAVAAGGESATTATGAGNRLARDDSESDLSSNVVETTVAAIRDETTRWITSFLERAEALKRVLASTASGSGHNSKHTRPGRNGLSSLLGPEKDDGESLNAEELNVLRVSSVINGKKYLPWMKTDIHEQFSFSEPFCDPDGLLPLSSKQKRHFGGWRRPSDFVRSLADPVMIERLCAMSITQDNVGDCSFVSSLCMAAEYERTFKRQLVTNIIYPQNRSGTPIYNPSGKYIVRLFAGGIARKVVVDDRLPVDRRGRLLCARTTRPNELWVSIIEKAYMKLNGGYDFPGSTACIDTYALTGWLPESIKLDGSGEAPPVGAVVRNRAEIAAVQGHGNADRIWQRLLSAFNKYGDCLVSISTTALTKEQEERYGLVSGHAYAVLRVVEVDGLRLLQVKNPWCRVRWKGRYSPTDTKNWTTSLRKKLAYDVTKATKVDNGIFWIDYEAVRRFFGTMHMNWNPNLFRFSKVVHGAWLLAAEGPKRDRFNIFHNPQYHLEVKADNASFSVGDARGGGGGGSSARTIKTFPLWILLSRHQLVVENDDHDAKIPLVAIHAYKSHGRNQKNLLPLSQISWTGRCVF
eukprot:INCI11673.1.p1 GENE.INCI11673.1~~INCI11673.1.p1  ORF type:complete len:668 (-),score=115.51 INCI11673.1:621-2456(-)